MEKIDFSKCQYFNKEICPGKDTAKFSESVKTILIDHNGKEFISSDINDFIKKNHCVKCPKP